MQSGFFSDQSSNQNSNNAKAKYENNFSAKDATVIAAIELPIDHPKFNNTYGNLSAEKKIEFVRARIIETMQYVKAKQPSAKHVVVALREYCITDGPNARSISVESEEALKKMLLEVTEVYPELTVVAGTVLVRKTIPGKSIETIERYYDQHKELIEAEKKCIGISLTEQQQVLICAANPNDSLVKVKNISLIAHKKKLKKHGKAMPSNESNEDQYYPKAIFQPAKNNNLSSLITFENEIDFPDMIAIDICRDHIYGRAQREALKQNILPFLHLVLAYSGALKADHLTGTAGNLFIDNTKDSTLLVGGINGENKNVILFRYHVLNDEKTMEGPIAAIPFLEFKLQSILKEATRRGPQYESKTKTINTFSEEVNRLINQNLIIVENIISQAQYNNTTELLKLFDLLHKYYESIQTQINNSKPKALPMPSYKDLTFDQIKEISISSLNRFRSFDIKKAVEQETVYTGVLDVLTQLLQAIVPAIIKDNAHKTFLEKKLNNSILESSLSNVELFLALGADPLIDVTGEDVGQTALFYAEALFPEARDKILETLEKRANIKPTP